MGVYTEAVQKLYVAYFNRPADPLGLAYWENVVTANKGSTTDVAAAFAASDEYKTTYAGQDNAHLVATVYQNLFSHAPDLPGLAYWTNLLNTRQMTINNVVTSIAAGAQGTDKDAYNNKVTAATAFSNALDTSAEVLGYAGVTANNAAKAWLSGITDAASLAAAIAPDALNGTVSSVVEQGSIAKTFTLTAGLDAFVGTAGNDVFNAYNFDATTGDAKTTLSAFDSLDGGAGRDTLNLDLTGATATTGTGASLVTTTTPLNTVTGTIKNIEVINLTGNTGSVDASVFQGATNINVAGGAATIAKLAAGTTVGFNATTGDITVGAAGASAAIAMTGIDEAATVTVSGSALNAVTISGTRADTSGNGSLATQTLNITAGKDVQSVTVTTNQATNIVLAEGAGTSAAKQITSIDASASTGRIWITGDADLATIKTGSAVDTVVVAAATAAASDTTAAKNASVSTGAGNDGITVSSTGTGMTLVDAGAGNDTITVNKLTGAGVSVLGGEGNDTVVLAGSAVATTDVINGGTGTDTVSMAGSDIPRTVDDYIVFNKLLTGFETIKFTGVETGLDASKLAANYTSIDLGADSAIVGVGGHSILANGNVGVTAAGYTAASADADATYAGSVTVNESRSGTVNVNAEALTLTVKAGTSSGDSAATLAGDIHTAAVTLTNAINGSASSATADTIATLSVDTGAANMNLSSLTLTGNGSATVINAADTHLVNVDASGLGGTQTLGTNAGAATQGLTYMSDNAAAETIKLGSGVDSITIGNSHYGSMDVITGLKLTANSATDDVTAGSDVLSVAGVSNAAKFTTTQTDLDLALKEAAASSKGDSLVFQLGGDTYVYHDNVASGVANTVDAGDIIVKLTGAIDLDTLILSLAHTPVA